MRVIDRNGNEIDIATRPIYAEDTNGLHRAMQLALASVDRLVAVAALAKDLDTSGPISIVFDTDEEAVIAEIHTTNRHDKTGMWTHNRCVPDKNGTDVCHTLEWIASEVNRPRPLFTPCSFMLHRFKEDQSEPYQSDTVFGYLYHVKPPAVALANKDTLEVVYR